MSDASNQLHDNCFLQNISVMKAIDTQYNSDIFMWQLSGTMIYMKYRDRNEIIAQILRSANGNRVRLTKIMYDVYLSHTLTKEYLVLLIEKGLIDYMDGERTFKTSDKGMNFLRIHNRVQELAPVTPSLRNSSE
jgi:predicted transcriptional regulator